MPQLALHNVSSFETATRPSSRSPTRLRGIHTRLGVAPGRNVVVEDVIDLFECFLGCIRVEILGYGGISKSRGRRKKIKTYVGSLRVGEADVLDHDGVEAFENDGPSGLVKKRKAPTDSRSILTHDCHCCWPKTGVTNHAWQIYTCRSVYVSVVNPTPA